MTSLLRLLALNLRVRVVTWWRRPPRVETIDLRQIRRCWWWSEY